MADLKKEIAGVFEELASALETGHLGTASVAVVGMGSEHGEENVMAGCLAAAAEGIRVIYLGTLEAEGVQTVPCEDADAAFETMEALLADGSVDAAVAMHYPFPIGVATVGRAVAPATGRSYFVATTTGTTATDRIEAMTMNAIAGLATAKAYGVSDPSLGLLNLDGARQVEKILKALADKGYEVRFAESSRADGGAVMRGNDVLKGSQDVLVTDSLTGNVLMKMLSSYTSGGSYETLGEGYGPGVGIGMKGIIMIVSRASGAGVITGAIRYAARMAQGQLAQVYCAEFEAAKKAGLMTLLDERKQQAADKGAGEDVKAPPAEVVTYQIAGIEVMDLEEAVHTLWKENIYAESGMGCTGPIVRVSDASAEKALEILRKAGYVSED